jgi:WD40 repeat protein
VAHQTAVGQLAFSSDGRALFSCSESEDAGEGRRLEGNLCVWSTTTGKLLRRRKAPGPSPILAPNGRTIVYQDTKTRLAVMDLASEKRIARLEGVSWGAGGAFSRNGKLFAVADDTGRLCLWGLATGGKLRHLHGMGLGARPFCFSPDGKRLVITSTERGRPWQLRGSNGLQLWDIATDEEARPVGGHRDSVTCLAFAPDMRTLASGSQDNTVRLWEAKTGRELRTLGKHRHSLTALAFSPDGRTLAAGDAGGAVSLWGPASGKQRAGVEGHAEGVHSLTFTPDGKALVVVTGKGEVVVRDGATAMELRRHAAREERGIALAVSPDGAVVVWARKSEPRGGPGGPLLFWDRATGRVLARMEGEDNEVFLGARFSPDSRMVLVSARIDGPTFGLRALEPPHLRLIEVATGQQVLRLEEGGSPVAFSPDGRALAVGDDLWDLTTGKKAGRLAGHRGEVESLAFSPDGARLASGSMDTTVLVWQRSAVFASAWPRGGSLRLADLWADLAGKDAARAHSAAWRLVAGADRAVPFLGKRLRPISAPDEAGLARLVADLDSADFAVRQKAEIALEAHAESAEPTLRAALQGKPSVEVYRQVKRLLGRIEARRVSPEWLRTMRAITVLERIGTPEAHAVLEALAGGAASAWTTREAKASLQRLARRTAAKGKTK